MTQSTAILNIMFNSRFLTGFSHQLLICRLSVSSRRRHHGALVLKKKKKLKNYCNNRKTSASISIYFDFTCFSALYVLNLYRQSHVELRLRPIGRHAPAFQHGKHDLPLRYHRWRCARFFLQAVTTGPLSPVGRTGGGASPGFRRRRLWLRVI